jgi:hypothetical protein
MPTKLTNTVIVPVSDVKSHYFNVARIDATSVEIQIMRGNGSQSWE